MADTQEPQKDTTEAGKKAETLGKLLMAYFIYKAVKSKDFAKKIMAIVTGWGKR